MSCCISIQEMKTSNYQCTFFFYKIIDVILTYLVIKYYFKFGV